ncbi:MAG: hypothetical protein P8163_19335, partial [Candidatus Thiodiazotropha sp.]
GASAAQLSSSNAISGSSSNDCNDWFTDGAVTSSQPISASNHFDSGTTIEQMSQNILSCIGANTL